MSSAGSKVIMPFAFRDIGTELCPTGNIAAMSVIDDVCFDQALVPVVIEHVAVYNEQKKKQYEYIQGPSP